MTLQFHVNGELVQLEVSEETPLLVALRERMDLTGSKYGCGEGACGACTVLVDGEAVRSCTLPSGDAAGKQILTIEGLERDGHLHPLQQAFLDAGAFQCGYCTPGMIMSALALLTTYPDPSDEQIVAAMDGNICRCGTYHRIVSAIRQAAATMHTSAPGEKVPEVAL